MIQLVSVNPLKNADLLCASKKIIPYFLSTGGGIAIAPSYGWAESALAMND
jgi:hypothetical protein